MSLSSSCAMAEEKTTTASTNRIAVSFGIVIWERQEKK
jgi:hypothetical protein